MARVRAQLDGQKEPAPSKRRRSVGESDLRITPNGWVEDCGDPPFGVRRRLRKAEAQVHKIDG